MGRLFLLGLLPLCSMKMKTMMFGVLEISVVFLCHDFLEGETHDLQHAHLENFLTQHEKLIISND